MRFIAIEKIWEKFTNKYEALILAAKEARRIAEAIEKNELQLEENPYRYALRLVLEKKTKEQAKE
uniref:DNA-directed RNA polymerase subunit omega n=1 Tax=candidate division WOR-3 bacterium TaxID=2052148 RepID=A0A7C6A8Q5_UNCW3